MGMFTKKMKSHKLKIRIAKYMYDNGFIYKYTKNL
jgi:ribosomal protein S8